MKFTKMHGLGNDYVYVNGFREHIENPEETARLVSDRHRGIGSDGLIIIAPSEKADFEMIMYNADGSRGEMCGNGMRCVGKYVYDYGLTDKTRVAVDTLAGIKYLELTIKGNKVEEVRVDMGEPVLTPSEIPVEISGKKRIIDEVVEVDGKSYKMTAVSMGNPHAVIFTEGIDELPLEKMGPHFENHRIFPRRVNTEFVEIIDRKTLRMRVWERGSGETQACGTGACAAAVAAILNGHTEREVTVKLVGGDLKIRWDEENNRVYMTGAATTVFDGEIEPDTTR